MDEVGKIVKLKLEWGF